MIVRYEGWSQERGSFCDKYEVNTNRTDMVIKRANGEEYKQVRPFKYCTADWNNDNDVYALFGTTFENKDGNRNFYTPEDLVDLVVEGRATVDGVRMV